MTEEITKITGITQELIDEQGIPPVHAFREFLEFSEMTMFSLPIVGHNIYRYDIPVLFSNLVKVFPAEREKLGNVRNFVQEVGIDTAAIFKAEKMGLKRLWSEHSYEFGMRVLEQKVFGLKYNVGVCCEELLIDKEGVTLHRAEGDVFLTNEIYRKMCLN